MLLASSVSYRPFCSSFGAGFGQTGFSSSQTSHVQGTIKDPTGAVIPRAKVAFHGKQIACRATKNFPQFWHTSGPAAREFAATYSSKTKISTLF